MKKTFNNLILLGRLAAGKSEFIDLLKKTPEAKRTELFHIGKFEEIDDFPWLWEKFLEDDLWEKSGYDRLYSHKEGHNMGLNEQAAHLLDFMIARFNKEISQKYLSNSNFYDTNTLFIEFSRGCDKAYEHSLNRLSRKILENTAILFIDVSWEESVRRNNARYEEKMKHSVLAHKGTDRVMEKLYRTHDWQTLTQGNSDGYLSLKGINVPFVTLNNEPELTDPEALSKRYQPALDKLFALYTR